MQCFSCLLLFLLVPSIISIKQQDVILLEKVNGFAAAPLSIVFSASQQKIYWTEGTGKRIQSANLDGSGIQELITSNNSIVALAIDNSEKHLYFSQVWTRYSGATIERIRLDGTGRQLILELPPLVLAESLAIDNNVGKLYWTDSAVIPQNKKPAIWSCSLDGTEAAIVVFVEFGSHPRSLAVNHYRLFWTETSNTTKPRIVQSSLDGTNIKTLLSSGLVDPRGLFVESVTRGSYIYWSDIGTNTIARANLQQLSIEIIAQVGQVHSLCMDESSGIIYYPDMGTLPTKISKIEMNTPKGNY
jgi:hypothetical protein